MHENPFADWSATLFLADRTQYVLVTNTTSLYSVVMFGRGITGDSELIKRAVSHLGESMQDDGYHFLRERAFLSESEISPYDASFKLNEIPMSYQSYEVPRDAFGRMRIEPQPPASE
ncbi:MAG TPA: hypothetical protein VMV68_09140 [Spirochaetia bacterium]|nr:hypothetical protein [Spirochaetia bacterium]